jgi:hypothetical protein
MTERDPFAEGKHTARENIQMAAPSTHCGLPATRK